MPRYIIHIEAASRQEPPAQMELRIEEEHPFLAVIAVLESLGLPSLDQVTGIQITSACPQGETAAGATEERNRDREK